MREIKFRAWINWDDAPRMIQVAAIEFDSADNYVLEYGSDEAIPIGTENNILMQYTGLKDKNGTEIYEGDIILPIDYAGRIWGGNRFMEPGPVKVEWDDTGGWWPFADNDDGMPYPEPDKSEVIGNIYENPELLKVAQK